MDFLDQEKKLSLEKINTAYEDTIKSIDLNEKMSKEEKDEAISFAVDDFLETNKNLNFSLETAFSNSSRILSSVVENHANSSAKSYLERISVWQDWGNLGKIGSNTILDSLKKEKSYVIEDYLRNKEQVDMQKQSAFDSLQKRVWDDIWRNVLNSWDIVWANFSKKSRIWTSWLNTNSSDLSVGNFKWTLNTQFNSNKKFNDLKRNEANSNKNLSLSWVNLSGEQNKSSLDNKRKAYWANYAQKTLEQTPYYYDSSGNLRIGKNAKWVGKTFSERNKWDNNLDRGVWQVPV